MGGSAIEACVAVCQLDWSALAQWGQVAVLSIGFVWTGLQLRQARLDRNIRSKIIIQQRTLDHNSPIGDSPLLRWAVQFCEGLKVPGPVPATVSNATPEEKYWAVRNVHLSHLNLVAQVWELAGQPKEGVTLEGYRGWERFATKVVIETLRASTVAVEGGDTSPENLAGADLYKGLSEYESASPEFVAWLNGLH